MAAINMRRVALGTIVGGVVWTAWSFLINGWILASRYAAAEQAGQLLKQPRYPFFLGYWIITLFLLSYVIAWLYASSRATQGPGPGLALTIGLVVGFAASFPVNLSVASWAPFARIFPLWWMVDLWVGAILSALVAGWLYKE